MDDFLLAPREERDGYHVVLFFTMLLEGPHGERLAPLERIAANRQGVVVLHHSILAFPFSAVLAALDRPAESHPLRRPAGADQHRDRRPGSSDHRRPLRLADARRDLPDGPGPTADSRILLTTSHPHSMRTLAWTRETGGQRIVCYQAGHDHQAWTHPAYRAFLARAIAWCARRI